MPWQEILTVKMLPDEKWEERKECNKIHRKFLIIESRGTSCKPEEISIVRENDIFMRDTSVVLLTTIAQVLTIALDNWYYTITLY